MPESLLKLLSLPPLAVNDTNLRSFAAPLVLLPASMAAPFAREGAGDAERLVRRPPSVAGRTATLTVSSSSLLLAAGAKLADTAMLSGVFRLADDGAMCLSMLLQTRLVALLSCEPNPSISRGSLGV